ncbi:phytanoyl-CoA dioxygenase family protein [Paenibacillus sp. CF384]|uniref:phytanoyl-CoA dioxygenase family protein n=1 Tax=Paenibacillus sp. CF384 TaxID=1884382 RepID=UPI0008991FEB|nr:phytanoyl-CoA dioxygenase family protein [Paenibacillus sp. CF384]SDW79979.1 Ectoine hydroxylase-related dioxygenase, phytanoyl-CoA dioxygenase (PhyH) family [Paenibacillus sp. CF384]
MGTIKVEMPFVDARAQESITEEQAQFFLDNGFLVIRNVVVGEELKVVQNDMQALYEKGAAGADGDPDFMYGVGVKSGQSILKRVEYVIAKSHPMKVLLGHPFILRSVEKLQGRNFIATWDSMVLKAPNEGIIVPWHRDAAVPDGCEDARPIFNVDFYLDEADLQTCLWVIPGSNKWSKEEADQRCKQPGFTTEDAIPVPMQPGDVIFHNIEVLHGSPAGDGNPLRRTVYYEFRPGEIEADFGPHTLEYLSLKQHVLLDCIERRKVASYAQGEAPFAYEPGGAFAIRAPKQPAQYRYAHEMYWRR